MTMNIFERAARKRLRFTSDRGALTTEQLFSLTLTQLDTIARSVNTALKAEGEESFIETTRNTAQDDLTLRLDILKHVIATKQAAAAAAETRAERAARRRRLEEALANKKDAKLLEMSEEELEKELADL